MRIVLSTSPHTRHGVVLGSDFRPSSATMYGFAPLGLLMLAGALREKLGITPVIFDVNDRINRDIITNDEGFYASIAQEIVRTGPDIVGFMTECDSYHHVLQICAEVKRAAPGCIVVLGGPHATAVAERTMRTWPSVDAIVLGEGEVTFCELVERIATRGLTAVDGTWIRDTTGAIHQGAPRALVADLDDLPLPAYDLYTSALDEELFLEVGRGCPFQCTFCSTSPFWQRRHRTKSPARILLEVAEMRKHHQARRIHFTHDLFTANRTWARDVCKALIEADIGLSWTCSSRTDTVDDALLRDMAAAGCHAIYFGIESGSPRMLKEIHKNIPPAEALAVVERCSAYGIQANAGLIIGFPTEDEQSLEETFTAYGTLAQQGVRPLHLFSYCPFAQSSMYQDLPETRCSGHFLDIPLPPRLDAANRALVASDRELFGAYFKPVLPALPAFTPEVLYALDEFSLLMDASRIPGLAVAAHLGHRQLFEAWLRYIGDRNDEQGAALHRRLMGGPLDFCVFLLERVLADPEAYPPWLPDLLHVHRANFSCMTHAPAAAPLRMDNYRTSTVPDGLRNVAWTAHVSSSRVLATVRTTYDVSPLIDRSHVPAGMRVEEHPLNLVWHAEEAGHVSLLRVNDFIHHVIGSTRAEERRVDDLVTEWLATGTSHGNAVELVADLGRAHERDILKLT